MFSIIYLELALKKKDLYNYLYLEYPDLVYIKGDTKY
jgi:hypothetical protein